MEVMKRLEQQTSEILDVMYNSMTNKNFDRVSDDVYSISGCTIPVPVIVLYLYCTLYQ